MMKAHLEQAWYALDDAAKAEDTPSDVDRSKFAEVQTALLAVIQAAHPELFARLQVPDGPLPPDPGGRGVVSLDDHRVRTEREFEGASVLYIEALWGKETVAFDVAIRDLERMRRGTEEDSQPLRPPETYHEAVHAVLHVRGLANDIARFFDLADFVRDEDDRTIGKTRDEE
jgi:hypothetical protein